MAKTSGGGKGGGGKGGGGKTGGGKPDPNYPTKAPNSNPSGPGRGNTPKK